MWMRVALVLLLALDPTFIANTVETLGATIRREYFDVDLRSNGGGSPSTVALLASYLLESGLPLWDIAHRPPESPDHYATVTVSSHDVKRPVYVLPRRRPFPPAKGSPSSCRNAVARRLSARSPPVRPTRAGRTASTRGSA